MVLFGMMVEEKRWRTKRGEEGERERERKKGEGMYPWKREERVMGEKRRRRRKKSDVVFFFF